MDNQQIRELMGQDHQCMPTVETEVLHRALIEEVGSLSARMGMDKARHIPHSMAFEGLAARPVRGFAPTEANCHSDGSVYNPSHRMFAAGGYGIHHSRKDRAEPPTATEETYSEVIVDRDGIHMHNRIGDTLCSSARAELMAVVRARL